MILLVNGPNLNLLGEGEPDAEVRETLADVERMVAEACAAYGLAVKAFQSNSEGALLDFLQAHRHEAEGVLLNPGALGRTSAALPECLRALPCPTIEVHLASEPPDAAGARDRSWSGATLGRIEGLGTSGYHYGALHLCALAAARAVAREERAAGGDAAPSAPSSGREATGVAVPASPSAAAPSPRDQLRWAQEQMRSRARPPSPAPAAQPAATADNAGNPPRIPEEGEPIPVDLNARGDYEPL